MCKKEIMNVYKDGELRLEVLCTSNPHLPELYVRKGHIYHCKAIIEYVKPREDSDEFGSVRTFYIFEDSAAKVFHHVFNKCFIIKGEV